MGQCLILWAADPTVEYIRDAGSVGILAFFLVQFFRGKIHSDNEFQRVVNERDRALDLVYKQADIAERALEAAKRTP